MSKIEIDLDKLKQRAEWQKERCMRNGKADYAECLIYALCFEALLALLREDGHEEMYEAIVTAVDREFLRLRGREAE